MEILTRKQASERGLHKYYTGKICKNGHLRLRYTDTGECLGCRYGYSKRYSSKRKEVRHTLTSAGYMDITYRLHPADIETVDKLVARIQLARSMS